MALSQREKVLLAIPTALGGLMLFYHWIHEPLFSRRAEALTRQEQVLGDLKRDREKLSKEGDLKGRRTKVIQREQTIEAWIPGGNSAALLIWYLSQAEMNSGAHVKSISVPEKSGTKTERSANTKPESQQGNPPQPGTELTKIELELKVDARFTEHLLFQQAIEQTPLFLNIDSLGLVRAEVLPMDKVSNLLQKGDLLGVERLLRVNPFVNGSYHLNLYFKSEKPGPSVDVMHFATPPGRPDPFVMADVEEFIRMILDHYNHPNRPGVGEPGNIDKPPPRTGDGQMG